jgi:hypothetical protein
MLEAVVAALTLAVLSVTAVLAVAGTEENQQILMLVEVPELPILVAEVEAELYLLQPQVRLLAAQVALV